MKNTDKEKSSILIIDDNAQNLQILADILRSNNYKVAMVKDGLKGLNFISKIKPDIILMDIMMPGIDGFEVCSILKKDNNTKEIPVIFVSALTDTADKVRGFKAGGVDYITKPFQKEEVLARVNTHVKLKHSQEELKRAYHILEKACEELDYVSKTDSLTKLSNRLDIIEKMKYEKIKSQRSGKPFSLILCDIDNFKNFNDLYGHDCGDFVLISVANLMRCSVREQDTVARWGGEEFLLLLPETNLNGSRVVAEKIKAELADKCYEYNNLKIQISMTFGISSFKTGDSIEECVKKADKALYKGKKSGKNCIVLSGLQESGIKD